ncbi:MAG TPA: hypothetical protein VKR43_04285 [Bryobacteraceae bacterium]|nr:hypothetical protein [Bryobacteraceae bacterium]
MKSRLLAFGLLLLPVAGQDLQGVWVSNSATPLERPKELAGRALLTDAEVAELRDRADKIFKNGTSDYAAGDNAFLAALANSSEYKNPNISTGGPLEMIKREFDRRTSLIIDPPDGRIPPLTPEGQKRLNRELEKAVAQPPTDGPEDVSNFLRCITFGVPRLGGNFGAGPYSYYEITQTPGYVVIMMELIHDARIIPMDGRPHLPSNIRTWNGDSRGRWEGKSLVIDTTNFSAQSSFMGATENLHLIEKFTRVAPDEIEYQITLDDPTTWTKPWTAMLRLRSSGERILEFACHEGNSISMISILSAARAQEKAAKK